MVSILPEAPGFGTKFARGLGAGISQGMGKSADFASKVALQQMKANQTKKQEDLARFQMGTETLGEMKQLVEKGNLGVGAGFRSLFSGETANDRARFRQLGTSLIPLVAAGVPIRNRLEFEEYKKTITDPDARDQELLGAIEGLEGLFSQKLGNKGKGSSREKSAFDASNPQHKAKAQQLFKKFKDKEKVREALKREFEGL